METGSARLPWKNKLGRTRGYRMPLTPLSNSLASSICDPYDLSLLAASATAGTKPRGGGGGQMIAPILLRKGTDESGTFSKKNAHNECSPFPREQSVRALTPHMRIGRVCHLLSKVLTQITTFLKRFKLTLQKQTSPEDKKEDDVFQRGPFIPAVAHLLTS